MHRSLRHRKAGRSRMPRATDPVQPQLDVEILWRSPFVDDARHYPRARAAEVHEFSHAWQGHLSRQHRGGSAAPWKVPLLIVGNTEVDVHMERCSGSAGQQAGGFDGRWPRESNDVHGPVIGTCAFLGHTESCVVKGGDAPVSEMLYAPHLKRVSTTGPVAVHTNASGVLA